mmetsp:Transcript_5755/g.14730  ORF Transcript_5755/g.14730 Transcript_5755/m.14730 type:complete len:199 (-) Transcript_5755:137-733(-)|eukprot:CAMPEP_0119415356 /NCGR_PEP_ID=MMETSP1335-20130426/8871_1 /TAXON_ID=259385 /ORGANISM="Chrysoculter rhomboideus, Strain RCC1486" /LENGTH=198 /DNA_ID=CAMNT_0007440347 /DNA_START=19 /DNA_END=615 /DNA_ORIENTATION=-
MSSNPFFEATNYANWLYNFSFGEASNTPSHATGAPQLIVGTGGHIPIFPPVALALVALLGLGLQAVVGRWRFMPWPLSTLPVRLAVFAGAIAYLIETKRQVEAELATKDTGINFTIVKGLVTTGPFQYSRNPLYDAVWPTLPALAVLMDSLAMLVVTPLFPAYLSKIVIPAEEALLSKEWPRQWKAWSATTPRWRSWF